MFKKCKVVMLPTKEKAKVNMINLAPYNREGQKLELIHYVTNGAGLHPQHLYIISDDKIEEGEFGINLYSTSIFQVVEVKQDGYNVKWITGGNIGNDIQFDSLALPKKIIATTDTSLTTCQCRKVGYHKLSCKQTYNLPQPSQQFIQKFIEEYNKSNVITDVMVEYETVFLPVNAFPSNQKHVFQLKINPKDNTITIKKLKDSWSREEVESIYREARNNAYKETKSGSELLDIVETSDKWIEENL